ncbi:MAG: DNA replication and repair protein RecF [bacterium]
MFIKKIKLKNFRNFNQQEFEFNNRIVIIEGQNGSGKTSLLESIYYACFFKSFRTNQPKDLIKIEDAYFFTEFDFEDEFNNTNQIQVALSAIDGRLIKLNKNPITSYKQIISKYKVISLIEDDLSLVQGAPEERRTFLNQFLMLQDPEVINELKEFKKILLQRNEIIKNATEKNKDLSTEKNSEFYIWSKQLWDKTIIIQKRRISYLKLLESKVNDLLDTYLKNENLSISFEYKAKKINAAETFENFWLRYPTKIKDEELRWGRSMFGAHLDDFLIVFQEKKARSFSSRGQQKLILFLIKAAQVIELQEKGGQPGFLIDDFLTDFDENRMQSCLDILQKIKGQIFITCPIKSYLSPKISKESEIQTIIL